MPVTAKLSRTFYERLGDDVANELVEWFNQVDAAYGGVGVRGGAADRSLTTQHRAIGLTEVRIRPAETARPTRA